MLPPIRSARAGLSGPTRSLKKAIPPPIREARLRRPSVRPRQLLSHTVLHTSPAMTLRRPPIPSIPIAATPMPTIIASAARSKRAMRRRYLPPPRMVPRRPILVRSFPRGKQANPLPTRIRLAMARRRPSLRPIRSSADPRMRRLPAIHSNDVRRTRLMRPMRVLPPTPRPVNRSTAASKGTIRRSSRSPTVPQLARPRSVPRTTRGSSQRSREMPRPMRQSAPPSGRPAAGRRERCRQSLVWNKSSEWGRVGGGAGHDPDALRQCLRFFQPIRSSESVGSGHAR